MLGTVQIVRCRAELGTQVEHLGNARHIETAIALKPGLGIQKHVAGCIGHVARHLGHIGGDQVEGFRTIPGVAAPVHSFQIGGDEAGEGFGVLFGPGNAGAAHKALITVEHI